MGDPTTSGLPRVASSFSVPASDWCFELQKLRTSAETFDPNVFTVNRNDDGLWLNTNDGRLDNEWNPANRFVFLRPRKSHHTLCTKPPLWAVSCVSIFGL